MRGLSLAELIVSIFVLGLLIVALANLYPTSILAVRRAEHQTGADTVAQRILEQKAARFEQLQPGQSETPAPEPGTTTTYHPSVEVLTVDGADSQYLRAVRVRVWWEYRGQRREVVHETWVPRIQP